MSRRNERFMNDDSPAMRREERAIRTKGAIQEELKRLAREEYERAQDRDWERVRESLEGKATGSEASTRRRNPYDISHLIASSQVAPDSRLGQTREKTPGRGRPPWA